MPWWVADMQRTVAWPGPRPRKVCKAMSLPHLGIQKVLAHADPMEQRFSRNAWATVVLASLGNC